MAQQKITVIAEMRDRLTGSLQAIERQADRTGKSMDDQGRKAEASFDKAGDAAGKSSENIKKASTKAEKALASVGLSANGMAGDISSATNKAERALSTLTGDAKDSASKIDQALAVAGERGGTGMVANLKAAGTKFVSEASDIGSKAGAKIKAGIEGAVSNIDIPDIGGAAGIAGGAGYVGAAMASVNRDSIARRVAAANGEDVDAIRPWLDDAYGNNFGADYEQLSIAGNAVIGTFDIEPGSPEAAALLQGTATISDLYELDPNQTALALRVFMDVDDLDPKQASDALLGVIQDASAAAREELPDLINEYTDDYLGTGVSAVAAAAAAAEASQLGGQYGADQSLDLIREHAVLLKENDEGAREGYDMLGLNMDELNELRTTGRADEALRMTMDALAAADAETRDLAGGMVMGSIVGDLGSENFAQLAQTWADGSKTAEDYVGGLNDATSDLTEGPGAAFKEMLRAWSESIVDVGNAIAPILTPLFKLGTALAPIAPFIMGASLIGGVFRAGNTVLGWLGSKDGDKAVRNAGRMGSRVGGLTGKLGGLSRVLFGHPLVMLAGIVWGASEAFKALYENSDSFRGVVDGIADSWQRANDNMSNYIDMADDAISKPLGLENEGGHAEYKEMRDRDIRPGWFKDFTRPLEEGLGLGPQSKPHEGLFSLPKVEEKHADGGWTSGNAYRSGERGREFVTQAWASNKVESTNPGALAYINATGELPSAQTGQTIIQVDARGAAPGVGAEVEAAVARALAKQGRKATREYMTPSAKGAH